MTTKKITAHVALLLTLAVPGCDSRSATVDDGGTAEDRSPGRTTDAARVDAPAVDAGDDATSTTPCAALDLCACRARSDCEPEFDDCVCDCVDYTCDDCPAVPAECACGGGQFVRCVVPKKYNGAPCAADDECRSGLCYSEARTDGSFGEKLCRGGCIALEDYAQACYDDGHCCEGRCCVGCGEREGLCLAR